MLSGWVERLITSIILSSLTPTVPLFAIDAYRSRSLGQKRLNFSYGRFLVASGKIERGGKSQSLVELPRAQENRITPQEKLWSNSASA